MSRRLGRPSRTGNLLDRTFEVSITLKGLDGVLEVLGGLLLLLVSPTTVNQIVKALTQHELSQDPHDFVATHLVHAASGLSKSTFTFGAVYLLIHGVVKVVLVVALMRRALWAYPWFIGFLLIFIAYQLYRLTFAPAFWLVALTVFDAFVVWLTYLEYRKNRKKER